MTLNRNVTEHTDLDLRLTVYSQSTFDPYLAGNPTLLMMVRVRPVVNSHSFTAAGPFTAGPLLGLRGTPEASTKHDAEKKSEMMWKSVVAMLNGGPWSDAREEEAASLLWYRF